VFPDVFFPKGNPKLAIIASLATYGVGYAARPAGRALPRPLAILSAIAAFQHQGDVYDPPERLRRGMGAAGVSGGVRQGAPRSRGLGPLPIHRHPASWKRAGADLRISREWPDSLRQAGPLLVRGWRG
jgi:hypothetical protein